MPAECDPEVLAAHARELAEARDLAGLLLSIMRQFPTSLDEFDARLAYDRLPPWAGGSSAPTPPETEVQHVVWYGGPDPENAAGMFDCDDEAEARVALQWVNHVGGAGYAVRQWTAGPWAVVEDTSAPLSRWETTDATT